MTSKRSSPPSEPLHQLIARSRIGGTVVSLTTREGDQAQPSQELAVVADPKLALQIQALDQRIRSQIAQRDKAASDFARTQELVKRGVSTQALLDTTKAALDVAERTLAAMRSDRDVIVQQVAEGAVLSPGAGRVLTCPCPSAASSCRGKRSQLWLRTNTSSACSSPSGMRAQCGRVMRCSSASVDLQPHQGSSPSGPRPARLSRDPGWPRHRRCRGGGARRLFRRRADARLCHRRGSARRCSSRRLHVLSSRRRQLRHAEGRHGGRRSAWRKPPGRPSRSYPGLTDGDVVVTP